MINVAIAAATSLLTVILLEVCVRLFALSLKVARR